MALKHFLIPTIIAGAGFFAAVGIVGGTNAGKFYPNTYINGEKVGGMYVDEVKNQLIDNRALIIKAGDDYKEIALSAINYTTKPDIDINTIDHSPFGYIFNLTGEKKYEVKYNAEYDKEKLNQIVEKNYSSGKPSKDAFISFKDNTFQIEPEVEGENYNIENAFSKICKAIDNGNFDVDITDTKEEPKVRSTDKKLNDTLEELNTLAQTSLEIDMSGASEKREIGDLIKYDEGKVTVDEDKLSDYVDELASKYNTIETKRKFKTTDKGEIEVGGSGIDSFGFKLDKKETYNILSSAILNSPSSPIKPVWEYEGKTRGESDIGNTYVEIDISRQHMWYYINGELFIDTDVRTGTESSAQWTPTTEGVFGILWKQRDKWFTQVEPVCHSDYWMPFNSRGEGIHDATWYSTYGGNYYKWSGSHGCINTPYNVVKQMFEKMEEGTPVIIYRS